MANGIDARAICTPLQLEELEKLAEINEAIKDLEAKKQPLVASVKQIMGSKNVSALTLDGTNYTMVDSVRRTVSKTEKDAFIAELVTMGRKHLIKTSIEPDLDGIFAEVDAGTLSQDFVGKYVKVTPVVTLRVT